MGGRGGRGAGAMNPQAMMANMMQMMMGGGQGFQQGGYAPRGGRGGGQWAPRGAPRGRGRGQ
jgi:hypothetical protein